MFGLDSYGVLVYENLDVEEMSDEKRQAYELFCEDVSYLVNMPHNVFLRFFNPFVQPISHEIKMLRDSTWKSVGTKIQSVIQH